ncbi:PROTEIN FLX-LIKE 2 [Salix purpurea]|uniref:PROTEIN FLX-LIKE 2 n=1 Tax=Salix purpurea TaxID=77065 RepID=A0A9Q0V934_SALPP|nr:PROTEIN FLX-LIKE 2 [Salix purpurea]
MLKPREIIKFVNAELVQVGAIKEEIETVQQEIQRGRSAIEYEKKTRAFNLEQEKVLEKNRILLVREIMKLRAELANAEKRARAAAAAGNPSPGYGRIYGRAEVGYGGSSYPDPNDPQQKFNKENEFLTIARYQISIIRDWNPFEWPCSLVSGKATLSMQSGVRTIDNKILGFWIRGK